MSWLSDADPGPVTDPNTRDARLEQWPTFRLQSRPDNPDDTEWITFEPRRQHSVTAWISAEQGFVLNLEECQ